MQRSWPVGCPTKSHMKMCLICANNASKHMTIHVSKSACQLHRQCKCIKYMVSKHSNKLQKAYKERLPSSTEKNYLYIKKQKIRILTI